MKRQKFSVFPARSGVAFPRRGGGQLPQLVSNMVDALVNVCPICEPRKLSAGNVAALVSTCLVTFALPTVAAHAQNITQLGASQQADCEILNPSASDSGGLVAFESNCDLTGLNADGNREIFQVGVAGQYIQLTESQSCANSNPSSNASGDVVAFDSDCDLDGNGAPSTPEIFIARANESIVRLTDHGVFDTCASVFPSINSAGDLIAYDSDCDPTGQNTDRSNEVFQVSDSGVVRQLSNDGSLSGCGSFNASTNAVGDKVAFESDCDAVGGNDDESLEIFVAAIDGESVTVTQRTFADDDACFSAHPAVDANGETLAFESNCDFAGQNADGGVEIFQVAGTDVPTQISEDAGQDCESFDATIDGIGLRVAYTTYCGLGGANADGGLEVVTATTSGYEPLTDGTVCWSFAPFLGFDIGPVSFVSDCDFVGGNPDGSYEVFQNDRTSCRACGAPVSGKFWPDLPVASDALYVLKAAIGLESCALCECDVDSSGDIKVADALNVLITALGNGAEPNCP